MKNTHKHSLPPGLCGGNLLTTSRCPQRRLSSQSLGKYWQLNQSNQHTSTYSRIQQQTKNPYYATVHNEYAQENPRINRQDRQKVTFPECVYPAEIPNNALPLHTQKQCTAGVLLGVLHPCLWPLKAPGYTLGEGRQTSRQPTDAMYPSPHTHRGVGQTSKARLSRLLQNVSTHQYSLSHSLSFSVLAAIFQVNLG